MDFPYIAPDQLPWQFPYAELGPRFSAPVQPTALPAPHWVAHDLAAAARLGWPEGWHQSAAFLTALSGNASVGQPVATVYAGHQFGVWAGQLGDGRALLLGSLNGQEVQLKGAGQTPFSRMGDGRAVLRSTIREFLACAAMRGLGIPTTEAVCITGSPAGVRRETWETAAVLTRTAPSFVRFGHFEHFSHNGPQAGLQTLLDFVADHVLPDCRAAAEKYWGGNVAAAVLAAVRQRSAKLVAQWQAVGFCHGVLNTDNMSVVGLTLDYGPFQFLDAFDPRHICNHTDQQGRYAFDQQPDIVHWNVFALAQALLPLIGTRELAMEALDGFAAEFNTAFLGEMASKLGCEPQAQALPELVAQLLKLLAEQRVDHTIFWRRLSHWARERRPDDHRVRDLFLQPDAADAWLAAYQTQLPTQDWAARSAAMLLHNPCYVLRNHIAETVIRAAQGGDFSALERVQRVLSQPFDEQADTEDLAGFPPDWAAHIEVSCSS